MRTPDSSSAPGDDAGTLAGTQWMGIMAAAAAGSPHARQALESLCRVYCYSLYAYVRRVGHAPVDAERLVREFFARLLAPGSLAALDPKAAGLRSFMLASLRHFLSEPPDPSQPLEQPGSGNPIFLDLQEAEARYRLEPVDRLDAEKIYDRRWALTLLDLAANRLRHQALAAGSSHLFDRLRLFITGESHLTSPYGLAGELGLSETVVNSALVRFRQRYRDLLREETARTVAAPAEIENEISYLAAVLER